MKPPSHRLALAQAICAFVLAFLSDSLRAAPKYNVLFIAVDDLKPALGCYGDPIARSPNIDALAARGALFERAYVQQAVCSPSRSSLLTGRRPDTIKVWDLRTHFRAALPDVVTLPQYFKNSGYITHSIGKIYHGDSLDDAPSWTTPNTFRGSPRFGPGGLDALAKQRERLHAQGRNPNDARGLPWEAPDVPDDALTDGSLAARAIDLLGALQRKREPFFLAVGFFNPHLPFVAPKKYWDLYNPDEIRLPANYHSLPEGAPRYAGTDWGELRRYIDMPEAGPLSEQQAHRMIRGYYAAVSYVDAQVGRLMSALDEQGLAKNTIVILWGDHGWHLGDHSLWCKHTNFENAVRAPLLIFVPGMKSAGKRVTALVEFVDIYPSLVELCGLPLPPDLEGTSFVPLLDNPSMPWKEAAFSQFPRGGGIMGYTMRTDRHRYVAWQDRRDGRVVAQELYDHAIDPAEDVNLAARPGHDALLARLHAQLEAGWRAAVP